MSKTDRDAIKDVLLFMGGVITGIICTVVVISSLASDSYGDDYTKIDDQTVAVVRTTPQTINVSALKKRIDANEKKIAAIQTDAQSFIDRIQAQIDKDQADLNQAAKLGVNPAAAAEVAP